ncbi:MAG: DNA polymerase III subunit delta [candidate division Zixibacteria bacterium]|nr:DNA polymerase III subunit delta [candidate division Zixibacteria bacterium]
MTLLSKISRYYFFYGADRYSMMKKTHDLVNSVITKGFEEFDFDNFEGRGLDAALLINAASSPPFGSPLRVVLLRGIDKVSPKGLKLIENFIGSIPDYTTLVMLYNKEKVDKRKKFFKAIFSNKNSCVEFKEPKPAAAAEYAEKYARKSGITINTEAAAYLVETVGCDIGRLEQELEKLSLYAGEKTELAIDDIALISGAGAIGTVPDLPEKLVLGDITGAIRLLHSLLATKESAGTIIFRLKDYFLNLNMAKLNNATAWSMQKYFKLFKKTAESLEMASRKLSYDCITNCLYIIYEGETALKSTGLKKDIVLMELIARLGLEINGE